MVFRLFSSERLKHAYIAIALALLASAISLFKPLDISVWAMQSKLVDHPASGRIVLVDITDASKSDDGEFNRAIARVIRELRGKGAQRIVVNVPLTRSNAPKVDADLRAVLQANRETVHIAEPGPNSDARIFASMRSDPYFTKGLDTLDNAYAPDFLQFVWNFYERGDDGRTSLSFALADNTSGRHRVAIDGTIVLATIPRLTDREIASYPRGDKVAEKAFVIGSDAIENEVRMAKAGYAQASYAHILAAETLLRGTGQTIPFGAFALVNGLILIAGLLAAKSKLQRRRFYVIWVSVFLGFLLLLGINGILTSYGETFALLAFYGLMRGIANYRHRHMYVDPITKAPNFLAFRRELQEHDVRTSGGIVVVKVLRLDAIFADLTLRQKRFYLQQIAKRLTLSDESARIFFDDGKYFAFVMNDLGSEANRTHLSSLRSVVSQPVAIDGQSLDVAITIGADFSYSATLEHRLSSAISATDQARESFRPVFVVSDVDQATDDWDHSLTARLSEALAEDRIKIKLQPQVDLRTGEFVAAESLARWHDADGTEISPASFISQCEQMGRLDDLTIRVLDRSMDALRMMQRTGNDITISINVSAVQFVDERIAEMVEASVRKFDADPSRVKLEITETARIEDFATAEKIMTRLRSQGIRFSLDDFGVGSANLEVLRRLPFEEVKIDRMFVRDLTSSHVARSIATGVLSICEAMGVTSVAEGIEDLETHQLLSLMGCDRGQGYFIARPQWVSQFVNTLDMPKGRNFQSRYG